MSAPEYEDGVLAQYKHGTSVWWATVGVELKPEQVELYMLRVKLPRA